LSPGGCAANAKSAAFIRRMWADVITGPARTRRGPVIHL
jgi:hypothetical protein